MNKAHAFYRISSQSWHKEKLLNDKKLCFKNFLHATKDFDTIYVLYDNLPEGVQGLLDGNNHVVCISIAGGSPAKSFESQLDFIKSLFGKVISSFDTLYLCEDDYWHLPDLRSHLEDGLKKAPYVTLYDHPDKYIDGLNPHVDNGAETTRLYCGEKSHWKETNSTPMTFGTLAKTLFLDIDIYYQAIRGNSTHSYWMFQELINSRNRTLVTAIPARCTHLETKWLSKHVNWNKLIEEFK